MQLSNPPPPPPLAALWDRVLRSRALPPDLDVQLLYVAIQDRLARPEPEVRLHALRVLADLLPLSGNALAFPFDQVVDNLGHGSPNVRKAALDALKVFCSYCEEPECAARSILDKCSYQNIRPHSADIDMKINVITGLILSIPSLIGILKKRSSHLNVHPIFKVLGEKLFDSFHRDVALRSLIKLRRVCGARDYMIYLSQLEPRVQERFRSLCEMYDEDSHDVYYAPRRIQDDNGNHLVRSSAYSSYNMSTDSSSEESFNHVPYHKSNNGKVIIETEIKFDSDTAITMTVLEENETELESDRNDISEDDCDTSDQNALKYSDGGESESDVVVKKVRFGGESVKIRTPDSENQTTSEDDAKAVPRTEIEKEDNIDQVTASITPVIVNKMNELKSESLERQVKQQKLKRSGIPLPVIQSRSKVQNVPVVTKEAQIRQKSKSLSELFDYFQTKNNTIQEDIAKDDSKFSLALTPTFSTDKIPSPVESHREVEVLHNLQRSPVVSPRRHRRRVVHIEPNGYTLDITFEEPSLLSPMRRRASPLRAHYDWEDLRVIPQNVVEQLHNQENWISTVKAADQLHSALLSADTVHRLERGAVSLVHHMWALSDAVPSAKAPAEGAVCALFRGASNDCARRLLPSLVSRMTREPSPAALPHALLQRLPLHQLVDLIFDPAYNGIPVQDQQRVEAGELCAALCVSRAAGPAAVLAAVRRRLAGTARADTFCQKLRDLLNQPISNKKRLTNLFRSSQLPVPVRRRARSTPPPAAPQRPRRLRPLPDSAPLIGLTQTKREFLQPLTAIDFNEKDSSAATTVVLDSQIVRTEESTPEKTPFGEHIVNDESVVSTVEPDLRPPKSPSIKIEDYSEKNIPESDDENEGGDGNNEIALDNDPSQTQNIDNDDGRNSLKSLSITTPREGSVRSSRSLPSSRKSSPTRSTRSSAVSKQSSARSRSRASPGPPPAASAPASPVERDVRTALAECIASAAHDDWEIIIGGLQEAERLAEDPAARAPAGSWRAAARAAATHVRSLRSKVARSACGTVSALWRHRGRTLDPELDEAAGALLDRCADANKFLRADAAAALIEVACGGGESRTVLTLSKRGASHRAGPARAAAAAALAQLATERTLLAAGGEPRAAVLRAAGALLGDAHPATREAARALCCSLAEDHRFRALLEDVMPATRFRAIEKYVDRICAR